YIKETSDLSFNSLPDLSLYIYSKFGTTEHYADALKATMAIYPELQQIYHGTLQGAARK
ncbi:MAG: hypothetical protein HQM02_09210, partial [Magnetococcales bacterium]|nr:hypothetical protein [Magnetococcales bacterium]